MLIPIFVILPNAQIFVIISWLCLPERARACYFVSTANSVTKNSYFVDACFVSHFQLTLNNAHELQTTIANLQKCAFRKMTYTIRISIKTTYNCISFKFRWLILWVPLSVKLNYIDDFLMKTRNMKSWLTSGPTNESQKEKNLL